LATSLARENYPVNLKGKYKARFCGVDYHDSAGNGQDFIIRCRSSNFAALAGTFGANAILFANHPDLGRTYDAPEFVIEAYGSVDLEFDMVAGSGIGTLSFILLTFEVEELEA